MYHQPHVLITLANTENSSDVIRYSYPYVHADGKMADLKALNKSVCELEGVNGQQYRVKTQTLKSPGSFKTVELTNLNEFLERVEICEWST